MGSAPSLTMDEWVAYGVEHGYALRSGHLAWDERTWVPTLVVQTDAVKAVHERGKVRNG